MKSFTLIALLFSGFTFLTSCQKDEVAPSGDQSPFVGTYAVAETSSTIPASNYAITISQSAGQPNTIEIGNFGDILKKNVLATVDGTTLTIPSQVFNGDNNTKITITGTGKLEGKTLNFTYTLRGRFNWDAACVATKN
jgi:hypothetical protein